MFQAFKKIPYKLDILIIASILAISIIEEVHINKIFYDSGCANTPGYRALPFIFLYEILKIIVVLFAIVRLPFRFKVCNKQKKYFITLLLPIVIYIGGWIFFFSLHQPGAVYSLKGFQEWVSQNIEVDAIQAWIQSEEAEKYFLGQNSFSEKLPDDIPDFIKNIDSEYVFFHNEASDTGKSIELGWSQLGGCWGIVIGLPSKVYKTKGRFKKGISDVEYRRPIKPGIYIFDAG
jgi:hypothetical protein